MIRKTAFAVYSDTDKSLDFYKRIRIPQVGETLNGKTVTNIYTGFETETYYCTKVGTKYGTYYEDDAVINTPWYGKRLDIKTVEVIDEGIRPQYQKQDSYLKHRLMNPCSTVRRTSRR